MDLELVMWGIEGGGWRDWMIGSRRGGGGDEVLVVVKVK
jgi:hypothetical protein